MESVKTGKTNKVGKNTEMANTKANKETHFKQVSAITNIIRSVGGFFTKIAKRVRGLVKKHPKKSSAALVVLTHIACKKAKELDDKVQDKSKQAEKENQINWWKYSGLTIAASLLLAACSAGDTDKQIELEQEKKEAENARDRANKSGIELEQERQKTNKSGIELANSQIKAEQERQKTEQEKQKANKSAIELEQQKQKTINTQRDLIKEQKDFIKETEQNCQENHNQFFIKKLGIKGGIAIEVEAECKTPKPAKTNQTPIQPKHLPNSKQPHSQRGSKAQEFIAYLQKELEFLPYSQKAIAKQVNFYKPSSIAYLELDPRDFKVTEEWQKENLKIRSKAQAKMLEMRDLKPDPQAHLPTSQSLLFVQKIFADVNKEIEAVANTEKKAEKAGYGYSKRM
ncbi:hypothetical protein SE88_00630 [Helicobacter pylori]|uniref:DUF874 family protein n=15 Tax=Helicobacter pylori TaxID=210 RepID=O24939_HELPY|nr:DUF874 family protein [Helicobacter pylori]AAD07196.1 predicted coding region HP0120 [Helicobacter pylori 26695]AFV41340.1 hypothetical protein C694_00595 [Helicobacter pylori 26695]AFV42933.1 hypothetical protein C695_00590 [Helicobacter pylori Rif1]AFV44528.1 hypothetical protein C730_00590 [Helicobacter pylori Rif2]AJF08434.1 hypothetical protein SE87_00630 [Helicobacter pylori 26695-1]